MTFRRLRILMLKAKVISKVISSAFGTCVSMFFGETVMFANTVAGDLRTRSSTFIIFKVARRAVMHPTI
ncbi:secreted protein [gut metagenome]|uniref:Secreted protein n=1 Tax=gut metagenome TaxID=749906 RepID=J9GI33_9ZZZZ